MSTKRINLQRIIEKTEGYSGAELKATSVEAGMIAIRDGRSAITNDDLLKAVQRINEKKSNSGRTTSPDALYN
jgi:ATP-dependent 26S proteasome regulatory subunit